MPIYYPSPPPMKNVKQIKLSKKKKKMLCSKQLNLKDVFPSILGGKIMTNGFTLVNVLFFFLIA